jgi:hypothetical protein
MGGPGNIVLYGIVKLVAYAAWSGFALRLAGQPRGFARAAGMGLVRWVIGAIVGLVIFFVVPAQRSDVVELYFAVYVPVRFIEWYVLSRLVLPRGVSWPAPRRLPWIVGGIVLSFLTDMVSPDMIEHGRFCIGRCLC